MEEPEGDRHPRGPMTVKFSQDIAREIAATTTTKLLNPQMTFPSLYIESRYHGRPMNLKLPNATINMAPNSLVGFLNARFTTMFSQQTIERMIELNAAGKTPDEINAACDVKSFPDYHKVLLQEADDMKGGYQAGFLALVHVEPYMRGVGLSQHLIPSTLRHFQSRGMHYAMVYTILPGLSEEFKDGDEAAKHLGEYVSRRREPDGMSPHWSVRIHQNCGAIIPTYGVGLNSDHKPSFNHAAVGVYDLSKL